MSKVDTLKKQIEEMHQQVHRASENLDKGEDINLTNLHLDAQVLNKSIQQLGPGEGEGLRKPLMSFLEELDKITERIKEKHEEVTGKLSGMTSHGKASKAYETKES